MKWRKEQKKGTVGPSGFRPILQGTHLIETSCKQSFKSTVSFDGFSQLYAQKRPLQPPSASQQMTQSYAGTSYWTQQQQHTATASFPARRSLPLLNSVEQVDIHQLPAVEPRRLADEFRNSAESLNLFHLKPIL